MTKLNKKRCVYFAVSGNKKNNPEVVFLTSRNRLKSFNDNIFSRNDYLTYLKIPKDFYKEHFYFERSSGIYRTRLTWKDLDQFVHIELNK